MTEFKAGDRVRVCDRSADHGRTGVIALIYTYSDTGSRYMVLLEGESECCGYGAHDLELIPQEMFKVGDRVEVSSPHDAFSGRAGSVTRIYGQFIRVAIDGALLDGVQSIPTYSADELRRIPTTHTRGTHPNSLANLAPGQERREDEWEEKRLRLSAGACDWLRKQGRGNMSQAVERLIMEAIEREESSDGISN